MIVAKYGQEGAILWPRILQKYSTEKLKNSDRGNCDCSTSKDSESKPEVNDEDV